MRPRQKVRGQAKPRQLGHRGKAKARQAEKLPRGGLEPRQLPRGLHLWRQGNCTNWKLYGLLKLEQINTAMKFLERCHRHILVNFCTTTQTDNKL